MEYPPSKRLKGMDCGAPAGNDTFGDDEDFTQDDLDEIDIITSQAVIGNIGVISSTGTFASKKVLGGPNQVNNSAEYSNNRISSSDKNAFGSGQQLLGEKDLLYAQLEEQQKDLKRRLKEVEEEILMRNGEIRVLRDSLRLAQQEKDEQRQAQCLLEKERARVQSEKEKELSKKVQSLQSELHFKEAEMNEMRTKLQYSERGNKPVASPVTRNSSSPRVGSPAAVLPDKGLCAGASPKGSVFITKETFVAQLPVRSSPAKVCENQPVNEAKGLFKDVVPSRTFSGAVLLNLLLQTPLDPSTVSLCHLLCISPDALPCLLHNNYHSPRGSCVSSSTSSAESRLVHRPLSPFSHVQELAMSGLGMLALPHHRPADATFSHRTCPGAVHLLPLLDYHVGLFCQTLEFVDCSGKSPLRGSSLSGSSTEGSGEESPGKLEEFALAALRALCHVVSQSAEAVHTLLPRPLLPDHQSQSVKVPQTAEQPPEPALLRKLLLLADPAFNQRECVVTSSLAVLNVLAEGADREQLLRLEGVLFGPGMLRCLSLDSSYRTLHLTFSLLAILANSDSVAGKLCSHLEACPLFKIFQYVTSRPDKSVAEAHWCQLEVEVVRFLTRLFTQRESAWRRLVESSCPCHREVVRTVVVLLHRAWMDIRGHDAQEQTWTLPGVHLMRESLMLLHWLLLNNSSFSEHCLDVLHMYEQVIPAITDTFRKIPDLTESEDLALEEICRPEAEETEDMDIDAGS